MAIDASPSSKNLLYVINVDWYFLLHWLDRSRAAREAGYEVHVVTCITADEYRQRILAEGFQLHELCFSRRGLNFFQEARCLVALYGLLGRLQPDIVHNITLKPVIYGGAVARWRRIPALLSVTGLGYVYSASALKYKVLWRVLEKALKYAFQHNTVIASFENKHDMEQLVSRNLLTRSKAVVVSGAGVDLQRFRFVEEQNGPTVKVLFAARLLMSKGLDLLVDAVRQLKAENMPIELHVAGIIDTESHDAIPRALLTRWIDDGSFQWHGQVDDIEDLIAASNIVCLPTSYGEGIPRILIEAAAVGRVVVAADIHGCAEFVDNNTDGLLVPTNDVAALCRAFKLLAADFELRRRFCTQARRKVEGIYSNESVIGQTLELYEELESQHVLRQHTDYLTGRVS